MAWTKILMAGDAAVLSANAPASVGTAAAAGSGTEASKDDHVHDIGVGAIDAANLFGTGVVGSAALGADAVNATHIDSAATDITFAQLVLTPAVSGTGTTEGTLFYDSDDNHLYVYVV